MLPELKKTAMNVPNPLPNDGFSIPLRASFTVFKNLPLFGFATNNLAPKLILFKEGIEFRVITTRHRRYDEIESVDARQTFGTHNLILCWRGRFLAFSANLGKEEPLVALLRFFRDRGTVLSHRAQSLLAERSMS